MGIDVYSYKQVEAALAKVQGAPERSIGVIRGRIKRLQTLGLSPSNPGKGKRLTYQFKDIALWALALEMAQLGLDPTYIAKSAKFAGEKVGAVLFEGRSYEGEPADFIYSFAPNHMSADAVDEAFRKGMPELLTDTASLWLKSAGATTAAIQAAFEKIDDKAKQSERAKDAWLPPVRSYCSINVSKLRRDLLVALDSVSK
ncbi:hypothetical protein ACMDCR_25865 [Labrys okinawensis]|uniref:hypothetical protein n=1 Tax=Labrys okinawensis TaxID=346911 RepID=UPI0039BC2CE1